MTRELLLDTHTLLWYSVSPRRLPDEVLALVRSRDRVIYISAVTAWELSIKFRLGKLPQAATLLQHYHLRLARYGFKDLSFSSAHALKDLKLSHTHKDPFNCAMVAQALSEQLVVVSTDSRIAAFAGLVVVWS